MKTEPLFKVINIGECPCCGKDGKLTVKFRNTEYVTLNKNGRVQRWTNVQNHIGTAFCGTCMQRFGAINLSDLIGIPGVIRVVPLLYVKEVALDYLKVYAKDEFESDGENPLVCKTMTEAEAAEEARQHMADVSYF